MQYCQKIRKIIWVFCIKETVPRTGQLGSHDNLIHQVYSDNDYILIMFTSVTTGNVALTDHRAQYCSRDRRTLWPRVWRGRQGGGGSREREESSWTRAPLLYMSGGVSGTGVPS